LGGLPRLGGKKKNNILRDNTRKWGIVEIFVKRDY